ncbi:rho GTPase-activating protein 15-like isoform X3 [Leptidea sinapis]|uniref:rho GTPase-activating protein 15-like isoform X3 n=1 Tax=Leptidea sinapis TaxID=189913 RepID=UPI00214531ED|nr:rho GTPase-activating protein 15-like isoform X3 [Leptidea sinapis]
MFKLKRGKTWFGEDSLQDAPSKSWNWSPTSERTRLDLERSFSKSNCESPPLWVSKRLGGSSENLLINARRPNHLQLPASSSGDSLDVEVRERNPGFPKKERKSRSMVAPKHKIQRPPMSSPRLTHHPIEATVLYESPIKRTKFFEGGKKSKKNWTDCYMILTPTALVFYKDRRTYLATRMPKPMNAPPNAAAPRAELVLPLLNAHIVQCIQMHTRRFTRSLVLTVEHDQYLLQDENEEGAKRLLQCIQNVIYKLGPPALDDRPSPQYLSSNTDIESLGRTPPVSRHANRNKQKAGGSSNEDLSDSTEVSKSHVRSRLKRFFAKRPAMEVLVKKGIYKDEPVFGRNLEEVCPPTSPRVPDFVRACVKEIESSEENMCTDGLYRASGNLSQVQKIRLEIDQNNTNVIENSNDIHVLTGSLKLFFRELKEPLIPCSMYVRVLAACSIKPREARIKEFRDIIQALPPCNRDTLKFLLEHLLKVTYYSERNRMHNANLAIVFGPTLLWAPDEQADRMAIDCIQQNNVVDILLNEFKEIFAEENVGKGKKKA